jgi:hypothetical protein
MPRIAKVNPTAEVAEPTPTWTAPKTIDLRGLLVSTDLLQTTVPSYILRNPELRFSPTPFAVENEKFKERVVKKDTQVGSLQAWSEDSTRPITFCVTGNPDESKAAYYAAYLVQLHIQQVGVGANPYWEQLYGGFAEPSVYYQAENFGEPTLLVISNLAVNSTNAKVGKAQDMLERFANIPKIVVAAGTDPISFMSAVLHKPVHGLAYFPEKMVKTTLEVI